MNRRAVLVMLTALSSGCVREETSLIDHQAWEQVEAADDPFPDRPATVDCSRLSWTTESLGDAPSLEIDTTACDYFAASQPTPADVRVGETLEVRLWHNDLVNTEPAEAHVALAVSGEVLWETEIAIPGPEGTDAALIVETWEAEAPIAVGETVVLHLHNHGQNSYNFVHFRRLGSDTE